MGLLAPSDLPLGLGGGRCSRARAGSLNSDKPPFTYWFCYSVVFEIVQDTSILLASSVSWVNNVAHLKGLMGA